MQWIKGELEMLRRDFLKTSIVLPLLCKLEKNRPEEDIVAVQFLPISTFFKEPLWAIRYKIPEKCNDKCCLYSCKYTNHVCLWTGRYVSILMYESTELTLENLRDCLREQMTTLWFIGNIKGEMVTNYHKTYLKLFDRKIREIPQSNYTLLRFE